MLLMSLRASHLQRKKNIPKLSLKYKAFEPCCGCNLLKYKIPSVLSSDLN